MAFQNIGIAFHNFGTEGFEQFLFRGVIGEGKDFFPAGAVGERNDDDRIVRPVGIREIITGGTEGFDVELKTADFRECHAGEEAQVMLDQELLCQVGKHPEGRVGLSAGKPGGLFEHGDRFII